MTFLVLQLFIIILAILNPTTLVLIDRMNFDIFIFLMLVIIALNRVYIFNWVLFLYCFLVKLYPIVAGPFIFIENKKRSLIFLLALIVSFLFITSYFVFIDVEKYSSISESYFHSLAMLHSGGKAGYWHIFGINTIPKVNFVEKDILIKPIDYYYTNPIARSSKVMSECKQISKKLLSTGMEKAS